MSRTRSMLVGAVLGSIGLLGASIALAGAAAPQPETSLSGDGPVVVQADPFTMDAPGLAPGQIEMTTVSTRPTLVTGGEARVQVRGLRPDDSLTIFTDGRDQSRAFGPVASAPRQAPGISEGLVTHLQLGTNTVVAIAHDARLGYRKVALTIVDHSIDGPVISGPHQEPFVCETESSGLGKATDANCDVPTQIAWYAKTALGEFVQLANPYAPPPSGTQTITVGAKTVPFIVRVESAVINRSITRIAVLDDPAARGPKGAFNPDEWNHLLLYQFGESCGTGFHQGSNSADDEFGQISNIGTSDIAGPFLDLTGHLAEGWMVAQSTLTTFGVSCNPLTSAETLMMVKEHIIDHYGDVSQTIGGGASGGAIQQYLAANNYPGLLDAGTPLLSFPDIATTAMTVADCTLMNRVFGGGGFSQSAEDAITGEDDPGVCQDWQGEFAGDLNPSSCPGGVPPSQVYNAKTNPNGVRCDLEDDDINGLGRDAAGKAIIPLDNVGVQYGLDALRSGAITPAQFIELNQSIGGFDHDGNIISRRNSMTPAEAALLYSSGEVTGRGALDETPIIDQSIPVADLVPALDIHEQIWPYAMRARLNATGDTASQAIWVGLGLPGDAVDVANLWLDQLATMQEQAPTASRAALVAASKPSGATTECRVAVAGVPGLCDNGVLRGENPRQEAGGPISMDNIDCKLSPVDPTDYPPSVTAAQLQEIRAIFRQGVCDYSAAPVGWSAKSQTWLSAGASTLTAPEQVPYPLVRSGVAHAAAVARPVPSSLDLLGPTSPLTDLVVAIRRAIATALDILP